MSCWGGRRHDQGRTAVQENLSKQFFSTESGKKKGGYLHTKSVYDKGVFSIDNPANPMQSQQLALIIEFFCTYMEPLCHVSRGKTEEDDTGKRAYRNKRYHSTDSPEPLLRPSPATGHEAEILKY